MGYIYAAKAAAAAVVVGPTYPGLSWPPAWAFPPGNGPDGPWPPGWPPDITEPTVFMWTTTTQAYLSTDAGVTSSSETLAEDFDHVFGSGNILYATAGMGGAGTTIQCYLSVDGGDTWELRGAFSPSTGIASHWQGIVTANGRILVPLNSNGASIKENIAYSDNGGKTWTEVLIVAGSVADCSALLELADGTILAFMYGAPDDITVYSSADGGETWASTGGTTSSSGSVICARLCSDGTIATAHRHDEVWISADDGVTFTKKLTLGDADAMLGMAVSGNNLVLAYATTAGGNPVQTYYSEDSGATWSAGDALAGETKVTTANGQSWGNSMTSYVNGYLFTGQYLWASADVTGWAKLNAVTDMTATRGVKSTS